MKIEGVGDQSCALGVAVRTPREEGALEVPLFFKRGTMSGHVLWDLWAIGSCRVMSGYIKLPCFSRGVLFRVMSCLSGHYTDGYWMVNAWHSGTSTNYLNWVTYGKTVHIW